MVVKETGAGNLTMRLIEMRPGGSSPFHNHSYVHEIFILTGDGTVVFRGDESKFKKDEVIFVSSSEEHQFKKSGGNIEKFLYLVPLQEWVRKQFISESNYRISFFCKSVVLARNIC